MSSSFDWNNFDASAVETQSHQPIPAGEYIAVITGSEMKQTKAGTGQYLELTFQIAEGQYEGRFAWTRLNLVNPNDKAMQIARAELASICKAIGVIQPKDSTELHDKPLVIRIAHKTEADGHIRVEVKAYKPHSGVAADTKATAPKSAAAPWMKK